MRIRLLRALTSTLFLILAFPSIIPGAHAQDSTLTTIHPHVFFDSTGVIELRARILQNPRLNKIWQRFKAERVDTSFNIQVNAGAELNLDIGRAYGDAISDLTIAYITLQDTVYAEKAIQIMVDLAAKSDWGNALVKGHISMGYALAWDVLYDLIPDSTKIIIKDAVFDKADNNVPNDVYTNINWTASAGEGLIGLAFQGDGDDTFNQFVARLLTDTKFNFKEKDRSVLWGHGSDGFPHQGLGYWRKYIHMGLFFQALRFNEPGEDWFHLGKEYPGSEFFGKTGYPRIYADVQHPDLATLSWADSRQVRTKPGLGPYGNIGLMTLIASEYDDGTIMDFVDYLIDETGARFNDEDWATFLFYDDSNLPIRSFRDLPLSRYWPDMEAAIFRSGWTKEDMVFYMRSGSPGGHGRFMKNLSPGGHDHPDANGFVIFYDNDYLAAEDGAFPQSGPDQGSNKITYGHNTFLIDGIGQKGDRTSKAISTAANMDYLDAPHLGYLMGDATDAYEGIERFYRYVIYKKHKYFVMVDELADSEVHNYEYLLGTDSRHVILPSGENQFTVSPQTGTAEMPVVFVEPRQITSSVNRDRPYAIDVSMVDLLRVSPSSDSTHATFFSLLYPRKLTEPEPQYEKLYLDSLFVSGVVVDGDEYHLYSKRDSAYTFQGLRTDARLCYFKDSLYEFEYLSAGGKEFLYQGRIGIKSTEPVVAAFQQLTGEIRVGKNLGADRETVITLFYPRLKNVLVDDQPVVPLESGPGWMSFSLRPKTYVIGPSDAEQTVTDNYQVSIEADPPLQILSPNGGELLAVDSTFSILWDSDSLFTAVSISYTTDAGFSWQTVTDSTGNDRVYDWHIPDEVSDNVMIRIKNASGDLPMDVSDAVFAIDKPPFVSSFDPVRGPRGATVSIVGRNLAKVSSIAFAGWPVETFSVVADSVLTAVVPDSAISGKISATNRMGTVFSEQTFQVVSSPHINSFSPLTGPIGTGVTIRGLNFLDAFEVAFNGVPADSFFVASDTVMSAIVPPRATPGPITASNEFGTGASNTIFVVKLPPQIMSFEPAKGPVGTEVRIRGRYLLEVTRVEFAGGTAVNSFAVESDSAIVATVPAAALTGKITVANPFGSVLSDQAFLVTVPPVIQSFVPQSGPVGTQVSIVGRHFSGASEVLFGDTPADFFRVSSDSLILATVPAGASTAKITVFNAGEGSGSPFVFVVYVPVRTTIFHPVADTHVKSSSPTTAYGSNTSLKVEEALFKSYLKFDVPKLDGGIQRAVVRLFVENESDQAGAIYHVSNRFRDGTAPWDEFSLFWDNAPGVSGTPLDSLAAVGLNQWTEFDVTAAITADSTLSFAIVNRSADLVEYSSKEGTNPPEFKITTILEPKLLPTVLSFSPTIGTVGDRITINGTRLNEVTSVSFGGHATTDFEPESYTRLTVRVPADAASGALAVANYAGVATGSVEFEFIRPVVDTTLVLRPSDDVYARSSKATRNYGRSGDLQVVKSGFSESRAFLKFRVEGFTGEILSARLRLLASDESDDGGRIFLVSNRFRDRDKAWREGDLNWTNMPTLKGLALGAAGAVTAGDTVEFDLTGAILSVGEYSFCIVSESGDKVVYGSKESGALPELLVLADLNADSKVVGGGGKGNQSDGAEPVLPDKVSLVGNFPNPFNLETTIAYELPTDSKVRLTIYNLRGRAVRKLVDALQPAGTRKATWDGKDEHGLEVASSVYFVWLQVGDVRLTRKILLQK